MDRNMIEMLMFVRTLDELVTVMDFEAWADSLKSHATIKLYGNFCVFVTYDGIKCKWTAKMDLTKPIESSPVSVSPDDSDHCEEAGNE